MFEYTYTIRELDQKANAIRQSIISMLLSAGSGHTAGPLGMADVFTALYFDQLRHRPQDPHWEDRDRVILSNGHICPVLYATMAHAGYFDIHELDSLRKFGSRLQGHPHREFLPYLENSSGPLGSGLSQAVGMALADRIDSGITSDKFFYCFLGDGELNEGNNWEAVMLAGKERLRNVIAIVDRNNIQIDGYTEDVMPLDNLANKWEAFNWHVQEIDGHNIEAIIDAIQKAKAVFEKPSVIIARTIPGKGVREFQRKFEWHGKAPNKEEADRALRDLRTLGGKIRAEHQ
jgi:transketolase